jgi:hypothetical protein
LFVAGGETGGRAHFDEDGFTGSQHVSACTDGNQEAALWRSVAGKLVRSPLDNDFPRIDALVPLRETGRGQEVFLAGGVNQGSCGETPKVLLGWERAQDGTPVLRQLPREQAVVQAFLWQCGPGLTHCAKLQEAAEVAPPSPASFADTHWKAERKAYLDAVLALDHAALRAMHQAGVPSHWIGAAIDMVSKAEMTVAEKRRRTAWLFRDGPQLARAVQTEDGSNTLSQLLPWLPAEDWGPVLKALKGRRWALESLRDKADERGDTRLSCRFSTALERSCNRPRADETEA